MSETTNIEWCHATVNFWWGCTKVSPGCANCYADTLSKRFGKEVWGKGVPREDHRKGATKLAFKLDKQAKAEGRRLRVFSASMSDWLDDEVPVEWLSDLLYLIIKCQNLDWLMLTKRPELWRKRLEAVANHGDIGAIIATHWLDGNPPPNVWIGTTVEDQARADERIPILLQIPAKVRFLSCEPLLEPVDLIRAHRTKVKLPNWPRPTRVDWVITGGESGHRCRHFSADWARDLRDQCKGVGVAFFMKQMGGTKKPFEPIPEDLMIREFPTTNTKATA